MGDAETLMAQNTLERGIRRRYIVLNVVVILFKKFEKLSRDSQI